MSDPWQEFDVDLVWQRDGADWITVAPGARGWVRLYKVESGAWFGTIGDKPIPGDGFASAEEMRAWAERGWNFMRDSL